MGGTKTILSIDSELWWQRVPGRIPLAKQLRRFIQNTLDNLPVSWCIHITGSTAVLDVVRKAFPVEILVQKIRLLDLIKEEMSHVRPLTGARNAQPMAQSRQLLPLSHLISLLLNLRIR
jgi:hypothetical protein